MSENKPTCETCRFWDLHDEIQPTMVTVEEALITDFGTVGEWDKDDLSRMIPNIHRIGDCRRYPPTLRYPDADDGVFFPETRSSQWCGEHQPITSPAAPQ